MPSPTPPTEAPAAPGPAATAPPEARALDPPRVADAPPALAGEPSPLPASPLSWPGVQDKRARYWRRTYFLVALLILAFLPLGLYNGWDGWTVAWHLTWVAALLLGSLGLHLLGPRFPIVGSYAIDCIGGVCASMIVAPTGPTGAPFGVLMALPLAVVALAPQEPVSAGLVGVGALVGGVTLILRAGLGVQFLVTWVAVQAGFIALAVLGAVGFRRIWISEMMSQQEKALLAQQLAAAGLERAWLERQVAIARLAAAVGHEINNPLAALRANLDYLSGGRNGAPVLPPAAAEVLDDLSESAARIERSVAAMRRLALSSRPPLEPLALDRLVAEARAGLAEALVGLRFEVDLPPELPLVRAARTLLLTALVNLIENAAEAAREAPAERRFVKLSARSAAGLVRVPIDDGGPGLSAEARAHLFQPFFTTRGPQRSGLGLAVAREQVLHLGGALRGDNRSDGGARFTLELPVAPPA
jgi:signal transduction histidine kinase